MISIESACLDGWLAGSCASERVVDSQQKQNSRAPLHGLELTVHRLAVRVDGYLARVQEIESASERERVGEQLSGI